MTMPYWAERLRVRSWISEQCGARLDGGNDDKQ